MSARISNLGGTALLAAIAALSLHGCRATPAPRITSFKDTGVESEIHAVLDRQVEAWNRRDLEEFMSGYWNSPDLTFFSGGDRDLGLAGNAGPLPAALPKRGPRDGLARFL